MHRDTFPRLAGMRPPAKTALAAGMAALLALLAASCGGGGMSSTAAGSTTPPTPPAAVAMGPITGFGSVHLNGQRFDTTNATITKDGRPATQDDLRVGEVVQVKSHHDDASGKDFADVIEFRGNVEGPVSAIDTAAQTLVVLGQIVVVSATTSFDDDISPSSLAGIKTGDILEVSGTAASDGTILATRIEGKPSGIAFEVTGTVSATDAAAKTLHINALAVDFSSATLVDFPASGPVDGDQVEAEGTSLNAAGALVATRLERRTGKQMKADNAGHASAEGLITRFASATDFDVAGAAVSTSASTVFEHGTAADLALNVRVEVEGTADATGRIAATKLEFEQASDTRITAQVDSVDAAAGTLVVLGTSITVDGLTRFEDHGPGKSQVFSLSDVHSGDWLEIRGSQAPDNSVGATRLERMQAPSKAEVEVVGDVSAATAPGFTVLATKVVTTAATKFSGGLKGDSFFAAAPGLIVDVRGTWDGQTLTAEQVQAASGDDGGDDHGSDD